MNNLYITTAEINLLVCVSNFNMYITGAPWLREGLKKNVCYPHFVDKRGGVAGKHKEKS